MYRRLQKLRLILTIPIIIFSLAGCQEKNMTAKLNLDWLNEDFVCKPFTDYPKADPDAVSLYHQAVALRQAKPLVDQQRIAQLYEQAAELGLWAAMRGIAIRYYQGNGVEESDERALYWYRELEKLHIPEGYYGMYQVYSRGIGVKASREKRTEYLYKGAQLGDPDALVAVAKSLYPKQKFDQANIALLCARSQGHKDAAWQLALNYETFKEFDKAYKAYRIGAKMGSGPCLRALEAAYSHFTRYPHFDLNLDEKRAECFSDLNEKVRDRPNLEFPNLDELCPANVPQPSHRH